MARKVKLPGSFQSDIFFPPKLGRFLSYLSVKIPTHKDKSEQAQTLSTSKGKIVPPSLVVKSYPLFHSLHPRSTMAEDSFLHLARPLGPVSVGTAPTTAPLNVVIQPQVRETRYDRGEGGPRPKPVLTQFE